MKAFFKHSYTKSLIVVFLLLAGSAGAYSQTYYYFYIQFANKKGTPYTLANPSAYLSQRAIDRRNSFHLSVDSTDLPITPSYLQQIENLGVHLHCRSKWMNGATAKTTDSTLMSQVRALPYVKFVQYTGKLIGAALAPAQKAKTLSDTDYGPALKQINMLNGRWLHNAGYRGKGMQIAVIDAGFTNVNSNRCFDSLRLQGRLLGTKDIINPASNIYTENFHGANVLSLMAGNIAGQYLGTAPDAAYWLIRTEYDPTEYKVETDFWASGIEFADSVGADLVNSSLGYTTFDDTNSSFTYADMNGKVSRASRAATIASQKGMVVVVSAGNDGAKTWHYIGSPGDADGIITVGSVAADSSSSAFSSYGPASDNRVKPTLCAIGTSSSLVNTSGTISTGNGTSYASPILCGMTACLLQKYKSQTTNPSVSDFINALTLSGHLYSSPTAQKGYGIPNFQNAFTHFLTTDSSDSAQTSLFKAYYNSSNKTINIQLNKSGLNSQIQLFSVTGTLIYNAPIIESQTIISTHTFAKGIYAIRIITNGETFSQKIILY